MLQWERNVGLAWEDWAQDLVVDNRAVVTFFNWVYIWLHWPLILGSLFFLYRYARANYVLFRNALFISGVIGLVFFVSYPLAPPRFLPGFTDTVTNLSTSYKILQPPSIVNKYAAMPSLHVGWNLLASIILYKALAGSPLRYITLVSPVLMAMAVVLTANHYVIDAFVGAAVALAGLAGGYLIKRWTPGDRPAAAAGAPSG